jgi:hypothetical protein
MAAGTLLSVARISVAINAGGSGIGDAFGGRSRPGAGVHGADPVGPQPGRVGEPGLGARAGGRFSRATPSADPEPVDPGAVPPTEPTRRI